MGVVEIKVEVPDDVEESFKRIVKELAKFYNRRKKLFELIEELRGSVKTEKSWKELREEAHGHDFR